MIFRYSTYSKTASFLSQQIEVSKGMAYNVDTPDYTLHYVHPHFEFSKKFSFLKPIYCSFEHGIVIISENIQDLNLSISCNSDIIESYLSYGFVAPPYTLYENVYKIVPFSKLRFNFDTLIYDFTWNFPLPVKESSNFDLLNKHLSPSFDTQYSLLFSGGVDSSIIALKFRDAIESTYSLGFEFEKVDLIEKKYALSAARELSIETQYGSYGMYDIIRALPSLINIVGEPIRSIQTVLLFCLFQDKNDQIENIVLNGQGADAIFSNENTSLIQICNKERLMKVLFDNIYGACKNIDLSYKWLNIVTVCDITISQWTSLSNFFGKKMLFPFYNLELLNGYMLSTIDEETLLSGKIKLKQYGASLLIPEYILCRPKASFGPKSRKWGKYLHPFVGNTFIDDNCFRLWNRINYNICDLLFCQKYSVEEVEKQLNFK